MVNQKTIYVVMPASVKTGGTELGHQLYAFLKKRSTIEVVMAYIGVKDNILPISPEFKCYVESWKRFEEVPDNENTIIILPEIYPDLILKFDKAKIVFWWMSVDNYLNRTSIMRFIKAHTEGVPHPLHFVYNCLRAVQQLLSGSFRKARKAIYRVKLHLYQSEYAREFLVEKGLKNILPLSDYINDTYFGEVYERGERNDYVLYNPKKGYKFTKRLIRQNRSLIWKPLEKMTTEEVKQLLAKSKVYIDFGHHPGKDRFPREAAIMGCCIITGQRGAAGNGRDIEIPSKYKFKDSTAAIPQICCTIEDCLEHYEDRIDDFTEYRNKIWQEKAQFYREAENVLNEIEKL